MAGVGEIGKHFLLFFMFGAQFIFNLGGFFTCYIVYPMMKKSNGRIPLHLFMLKRWLRTFPTLAATIFITFVARQFVHHSIAKEAFDFFCDSCQTGWWKTLFMVNNINDKFTDIVSSS